MDERTDPQFKLRLKPDLKAWLSTEAKAAKRSMNGQIVLMLEIARHDALRTQSAISGGVQTAGTTYQG